MQDKSRYEEVPQKENPFLKVLKMFGQYLKNLGFDFVQSFKYNDMKLASLLIMVPGALLGFFLHWHAAVVNQLVYSQMSGGYYKISFDYSGLVLFLLMLFGILNIFSALQMQKTKNLGSVVLSTIFTVLIIVCAVLYIYAIATYLKGTSVYFTEYHKVYDTELASLIKGGASEGDAAAEAARLAADACKDIGIPVQTEVHMDANYMVSIISVGVCAVSSVAGCVLGYIHYDRTYEKVDR